MKNKLTATVATLALLLSLLTLPACDPPKRERLVKIAGYGQQIVALINANLTLPETLHANGVITAEVRDRITGYLLEGRTAAHAFNAAMHTALASEQPDYAALVPLVADMIAVLQRLTVDVKSEQYRKTLLGIEIALRSIASFFALQIRQARSAGYAVDSLAGVRVIEGYVGG